MRIRIALGRFLIRLGGFIESLAGVVMKPDDLIEFSRQAYSKPGAVEGWAAESVLSMGLSDEEKAMLESLPRKNGRLLLLGVGGGREAVPLGRAGFEVTGMDFVPGMVENAVAYAARHGVKMDGFVQELSKLHAPANSYDVVWLSAAMYSCIPTRRRRVETLKRIRTALRSGGFFVCQFQMDTRQTTSRMAEILRKTFACLTLGNFGCETGDTLWQNMEFIHVFPSLEALKSEFEEAGFNVCRIQAHPAVRRGGALLRKGDS